MNKRVIAILLISAVLLFAGCQSGDSIQETRLNIEGMVCGSCEGRLTTTLEDIGVTVVEVSAADDFAEISYDSDEISLDEIKRAIEESGLEVAD